LLITPHDILVQVPSGVTEAKVDFNVFVFYKELINHNCNPSSGDFFKFGHTLVECKAFDRFGSGVVAIFPVNVVSSETLSTMEMKINYGDEFLYFEDDQKTISYYPSTVLIVGIFVSVIGIIMIWFGGSSVSFFNRSKDDHSFSNDKQ